MNRFEYGVIELKQNEIEIRRDKGIRLYNGDVKTTFEGGETILTNYRIFYKTSDNVSFFLYLRYIVFFEEEIPGPFFFTRSKKVVLHLSEPASGKQNGPMDDAVYNFIKFSFKEGLDPNFIIHLSDVIMKRAWEAEPLLFNNALVSSTSVNNSGTKMLQPRIKPRTGIIGIERNLQEQQRATDESISIAFQDLRKLMKMAKDMVSLTKLISAKIRERQGDITEDETVKFKAYLMSLGIDDPVTRDAYKTSNEYFTQLARQLSDILEVAIKEVGGMMTLTDVYCRVNRARGLELLSPEDLLNACRQLSPLNLPIELRVFDSGVMVLQTQTHNDYEVAEYIAELIKNQGPISATELAQSQGISVLLAKEKLLIAEKNGKVCRDDTIEALRFYENKFLQEET